MIESIKAHLTYKGNIVRRNIARPVTVQKLLLSRQSLSDVAVVYWVHGKAHHCAADSNGLQPAASLGI